MWRQWLGCVVLMAAPLSACGDASGCGSFEAGATLPPTSAVEVTVGHDGELASFEVDGLGLYAPTPSTGMSPGTHTAELVRGTAEDGHTLRFGDDHDVTVLAMPCY